MSQAEELLTNVTEQTSVLGNGALGTMLLGIGITDLTEPHIIVGRDRTIIVPEELKRLAVQFDHNIETVTFDCPRYWDDHDMSTMRVYINYMRSDKVVGSYLTENVTIDADDDTVMHFDWVISQNVTAAKGTLSFLVCIKRVDADGVEENHWNSELNQDAYISEGLECEESIIEFEPDLISAVLTRMDHVEALVQPDVLSGYINDYINNNPEMVEVALNTIVTPEAMQEYVDNYLEENSVRVEVDTTLTVAGQAADAKATGDAITAVDTKFNDHVKKSGDTMTGPIAVANTTKTRNAVFGYESSGAAAIQNKSNDANRVLLELGDENTALKYLLKLIVTNGGSSSEYPIFHKGNKPSGSYTGDGSETARTIDTGGDGSVIVIWHNGGLTFLADGNLLYFTSSGVNWSMGFNKFVNGVLTISSTESYINKANKKYYYQVL